ncbi:MAG: DUF1800 family protein [Deltaproteobacteria bacterium]|nr:DUF1800 family protein [Deltaproteobacteria bacterium]MBI3389498.1 DUF1800 family protein [Deltaproteobacteria bacterium]
MPIDPNAPLSLADARQLLRRAGFGGTPTTINNLLLRTATRGAAADGMLRFPARNLKPIGADMTKVRHSWIRTMFFTAYPLRDKLVLFWHDHFATSAVKVTNPKLMYTQIGLLYLYYKGNFKDFVKAINKDPAMIEFLDTQNNNKQEPNENYARELQELFTLGVKDLNGNNNYAQEDVAQIARAFTGWRRNLTTVKAEFHPSSHDFMANFPSRGPKVIYKNNPAFGAGGAAYAANAGEEGPQEIDTVIDKIFLHQDSDGKNTVARYIANKLFTYLCHSQPTIPVIDEIIAFSSFDTFFDIGALVKGIICHDEFYATEAAPAPYTATTKKSVKWPVDYVMSTLRLLGVRPYAVDFAIRGGSYADVVDHMDAMGQLLLEPPSVFGWDWETSWVSSTTLLARCTFARDVVAARDRNVYGFRPELIKISLSPKVFLIDLTDPTDILTNAAKYLGIDDQLSTDDVAALVTYLRDDGQGGQYTTLDLHDYNIRNTKLYGLFGILLQSPAYQIH